MSPVLRRQTECQPGLGYQSLTVSSRMMIIACIAISHRYKGTEDVPLVVQIDAALQRVKTIGLVSGVARKGLDMIVTDVTAHRETLRQIEILADTIEYSSGKVFIKTHIVRTKPMMLYVLRLRNRTAKLSLTDEPA